MPKHIATYTSPPPSPQAARVWPAVRPLGTVELESLTSFCRIPGHPQYLKADGWTVALNEVLYHRPDLAPALKGAE